MAKDFFVDLSQAHKEDARSERAHSHDNGERTIRNVMVTRRTPGPRPLDPRETAKHRPARGRTSMALWIAAAIVSISLLVLLALALFSKSTVTVTPRVHNVTFDSTALFSAMPSGVGLTYAVQTVTLEESVVVPAQGVERVEDRATGEITVYNSYSDAPVRLIKNTRFETPNGLIYRIPSSIVVPGKTASGPGTLTVSVIADAAGPGYNSGPVEKLTVPGLKSTQAMYDGVYGQATQGMSGGFVGERPAVAADALEAARAQLRTKLSERLVSEAAAGRDDVFVFPTLAEVTFEHLPSAPDSSGARVGEKLMAKVPVFIKDAFAESIAQAVSAEAGSSRIVLRPGTGFAVTPASSTPSSLDEGPVQFSIAGAATLIWYVDTDELRGALLGKDKDAFKPIISQFPGVERADAQIAPFWSSTLPSNPDKLNITIAEPAETP